MKNLEDALEFTIGTDLYIFSSENISQKVDDQVFQYIAVPLGVTFYSEFSLGIDGILAKALKRDLDEKI